MVFDSLFIERSIQFSVTNQIGDLKIWLTKIYIPSLKTPFKWGSRTSFLRCIVSPPYQQVSHPQTNCGLKTFFDVLVPNTFCTNFLSCHYFLCNALLRVIYIAFHCISYYKQSQNDLKYAGGCV
jgi:hypothetical protein